MRKEINIIKKWAQKNSLISQIRTQVFRNENTFNNMEKKYKKGRERMRNGNPVDYVLVHDQSSTLKAIGERNLLLSNRELKILSIWENRSC